MKVTFLGSGNYFTRANFHSNVLVEHKGHTLLIDAGSDLKRSLAALDCGPPDGFSVASIDSVFISHLHDDHCGGLEWLGFMRHFLGLPKPTLFLPLEVFQYLWPCKLAVGMDRLGSGPKRLDDYFDVNIVEEDFFLGNEVFQLVRVPHIMDSFGLYVPQWGVWYTSDCSRINHDLCKSAQIIFHDCEIAYPSSGVHTHLHQLLMLSEETRKKIWLYHLGDGDAERIDPDMMFAGVVKAGQQFDIVQPAFNI